MFKLDYRQDPRVGTDKNGNQFDWIAADRSFSADLAPSLTAAAWGDMDLRPFCTDTNQLNMGACAGNSTADSIEVLNAIADKQKGVQRPPVQMSRLFIYSMARGMMDEDGDGNADIDKDNGTYIRLCFEVLSRYGICDETVWPYDTSKVFTAPSLKALRQATGHRIHSYYRIKESGDDRCDAVRFALRAMHPVVFGTQVDNAFMSLRGSMSPVNHPQGATAGGHAMLIVGCLGDNFLVKNSWGSSWGDHGYWLMSPDYLKWEETSDIWVPTMGSNF